MSSPSDAVREVVRDLGSLEVISCDGCGMHHSGILLCVEEDCHKPSEIVGYLPALNLFAGGKFLARFEFYGAEQEAIVRGAIAALNTNVKEGSS
jgi:hypothetical protein